jgi:hypothetical protein
MKRTKKITKQLEAIAKGMPRQEYVSYGTLVEKGCDLIQKGIMEDGDKKPILTHKEYLKKIPVKNEVNHFNRLKSAFDSNGIEGVKKYVKPLLKPELQAEFFERLQNNLR